MKYILRTANMDVNKVRDTVIFNGMTDGEIEAALKGLKASEKKYEKGEAIFLAGDITSRMGLVLSGSVTIESNDVWGNRMILSHVEEGGFFAETYGLLGDEIMLVDVIANEDSEILFLTVKNLTSKVSDEGTWVIKAVSNLLSISAQKNLMLSGRSFHTSPKTIRDRVMSYLNSLYIKQKSREIVIPFDRQQLADYLNVERTALSKELGKMRDDGLISFKKNRFTIEET
jgi:CRP-like cAMP-binding protein